MGRWAGSVIGSDAAVIEAVVGVKGRSLGARSGWDMDAGGKVGDAWAAAFAGAVDGRGGAGRAGRGIGWWEWVYGTRSESGGSFGDDGAGRERAVVGCTGRSGSTGGTELWASVRSRET